MVNESSALDATQAGRGAFASEKKKKIFSFKTMKVNKIMKRLTMILFKFVACSRAIP